MLLTVFHKQITGKTDIALVRKVQMPLSFIPAHQLFHLIQRNFKLQFSQENILKIRSSFVPYYNVHNADYSRPYPGIPELLAKLQEQGIKLAVASNKYQAATEKLVKHYFPEIHFAAVLGQREGIPTKPDPGIVRDCMHMAEIENREEVLYVGDSNVDMQTALNAGVDAVGVAWGFRPESELKAFCPKCIAHDATEILNLINKE